jgi:sulfate transport system ATP-binding protein
MTSGFSINYQLSTIGLSTTRVSIELKNVTKKFGDAAVVNNVSFSVKEGELMALLGPSGGGKTTVLRMIAGLEMPSAGDVFIRGKRVNDLSVQQRNIGFVFQNYALFKNMNVFKNIAFGLKIKKWKRTDIQARIAGLLTLFGLEGLEKRYPHQLSGGQRQRVAIARALAPNPSVLLLDEPFGAVDAKIRQELREWLVTLHHDLNVTTIFVTHDQEEALEVANRIAIFSRGTLEQVGTPREVYEQPTNEFVARFIGVMNVLELEVRDGVARINELEFPAQGMADGQKLRIGFRPYAVQISTDLAQYHYRAVLRHTFFLGVLLRVELELPSGLTLRARMSKEEYAHQGLEDGREVSFEIRQYRVLAREKAPLLPEAELNYPPPPVFGENI